MPLVCVLLHHNKEAEPSVFSCRCILVGAHRYFTSLAFVAPDLYFCTHAVSIQINRRDSGTRLLALNAGSVTYKLYDLGQIASPLCLRSLICRMGMMIKIVVIGCGSQGCSEDPVNLYV